MDGEPFNDEARAEIRQTVRYVRSLYGRPPSPPAADAQEPATFHLARATEFKNFGNIASFQILQPDGDKGDEIDSDEDEIDAYVREGLVVEDGIYILIELCGADDTLFEVVNPVLGLVVHSQESMTQGSACTVRADDADSDTEFEAKAKFGDIDDDVDLWCAFDKAAEEWILVQQPCSS